MTHTDRLPFVFYEIKSEGQPSANGATTRPGPPIDRKVQKMDDLRIYAEEWLTQMQRACLDTGVSFTIPSRKEEQQGVITLEWMRSFPPGRTLTILIDEHGAEYVRSDITGQVGVGKVADTDIFLLLWHWLAL